MLALILYFNQRLIDMMICNIMTCVMLFHSCKSNRRPAIVVEFLVCIEHDGKLESKEHYLPVNWRVRNTIYL
jgi:hypothetical protein